MLERKAMGSAQKHNYIRTKTRIHAFVCEGKIRFTFWLFYFLFGKKSDDFRLAVLSLWDNHFWFKKKQFKPFKLKKILFSSFLERNESLCDFVVSLWYPCGIPVVFLWYPCGIPVASLCEFVASICDFVVSLCDYVASLCDFVVSLCDFVASLCDFMVSLCDFVASLCDFVVSLCDYVASLFDFMVSLCDFVASLCDFVVSLCDFVASLGDVLAGVPIFWNHWTFFIPM